MGKVLDWELRDFSLAAHPWNFRCRGGRESNSFKNLQLNLIKPTMRFNKGILGMFRDLLTSKIHFCPSKFLALESVGFCSFNLGVITKIDEIPVWVCPNSA